MWTFVGPDGRVADRAYAALRVSDHLESERVLVDQLERVVRLLRRDRDK
jgi:hypothetical protein